MDIKTKFNLDQIVYPIEMTTCDGFKKCITCKGKKNVTIKEDNSKMDCPTCNGFGGEYQKIDEKWKYLGKTGIIGKVSSEVYSKKYKRDYTSDLIIFYMLDITGVGSGSNWNEDNIFSSLKEAKDACIERNKVLLEIKKDFRDYQQKKLKPTKK